MQEPTFESLGLIEPLLRALREEGYVTPTPIQSQAIPHLLDGRDLLGCAQTGTGKTAAFALPILQRMHNANVHASRRRPIRTLILTPTRELAIQIEESFRAYGRFTALKCTVVFGGVGQRPQTDALRDGVEILVATPGRLLDLMNQGFVDLKSLETFVLDEADRMLDMGFIHDVKRVISALPAKRQTLFFSATMPPEIQRLSASILTNPVKIEVTPASSTAETVVQHLYFVDKVNKGHLLVHLLMSNQDIREALVFTRTKHGANKLVNVLEKAGIRAEAIHGNKAQTARQRALSNFKEGRTRVLVATDIAARGIDIDMLSHVVNYDLPNIPESYVHRIGRTGRAGASGIALSFCDAEEKAYLRDIQRLIRVDIPVVYDQPFPMTGAVSAPEPRRENGPGPRHTQRHSPRGPAPAPRRGPDPAASRERATPLPQRQAAPMSAPRSFGTGATTSPGRASAPSPSPSADPPRGPRRRFYGGGRSGGR